MSSLWQQIHALRTPREYRINPGEELHHHVTRNIIPFLDSIPSQVLAQGDDKSISDPLEVLNPAEDTLPYLYILIAQIAATTQGWKEKFLPDDLEVNGALWKKISMFLANFDSIEIRYAGSRWLDLMDTFDYVTSYGKTLPTMGFMAQAMLRMDPSAGTFTTTHLHFVKLCLRTRSLEEARTILDHDIHSLPSQDPAGGLPCSSHYLSNEFVTLRAQLTGKVVLAHILEYYLLGALVYISLHDWTRALFFLEHVLSTPTNNIANGLMLEAYRKWVLVGLLANDQMPVIPKPANAQAMKAIRSASKAYESIAEAFKGTNRIRLNAEAHEGDAKWQEDGNGGLIRHVLEHHRELSVVHLGRIYAALPISTIKSRLNFSSSTDAEAYLRLLIDRGVLQAVLDRPDHSTDGGSIVRFLHSTNQTPTAKTENQLQSELIKQTRQIKLLGDHVNEVDRRMGLSKEYLDHVRRARKAEQDRNSPEHENMDMSFAPGRGSDEEENVMTDVG